MQKNVLNTDVPFIVSLSTGYYGPRRILLQKAAWVRDTIKGTRPVLLLRAWFRWCKSDQEFSFSH